MCFVCIYLVGAGDAEAREEDVDLGTLEGAEAVFEEFEFELELVAGFADDDEDDEGGGREDEEDDEGTEREEEDDDEEEDGDGEVADDDFFSDEDRISDSLSLSLSVFSGLSFFSSGLGGSPLYSSSVTILGFACCNKA